MTHRTPMHRSPEAPVFALAMVLALASAPFAASAQPNPGFAMLGHLQTLTVDDAADPLSAGRLTVNGVPVRLPRNLFVTMPGQYLTVSDLFRGKRPGSDVVPGPGLTPPQTSSNLALADAQREPVAIEVEVMGNIVGGEYRAGVMRLSQQGLNVGQGFIRDINHERGELLVGPDAGGPPVARVRINDVTGAYGKRNADKTDKDAFDERFAADPGNAAIVASTGFPMCIPEKSVGDSFCPARNRAPATGAFAASQGRRFTCDGTAAEPTAPALAGCLPGLPAPLQVGDFISYSGMLTEDSRGSGTFFLAAHAIQALLGIYTSPGANPAYVFTEVTIVGTLGDPWPGIDQEETSRFRIVGFTTDPSRRVKVYAVDSPGTPSQPSILPADPDAGPGERLLTVLQPSPTAQIGRVRTTLDAKSNFLPITRDILARIEGHPHDLTTSRGLAQGRYTSPVSEYIAPENTRFGRPRSPVAAPFENFCFLSRGGEALSTLGRTGPAIGPLQPFPDSGRGLVSQTRADGLLSCP
ncbi:hypothetical protein ACSFA3_08890 [Variovorax sp. RHLX14]|uniref:hypothetical protein n=1 Tax=Variovorax sp. RHLX14 TaxID=1259731 RepID=UPI003F445925